MCYSYTHMCINNTCAVTKKAQCTEYTSRDPRRCLRFGDITDQQTNRWPLPVLTANSYSCISCITGYSIRPFDMYKLYSSKV